MTDLCRSCCKIFCKNRDSVNECKEKRTFVEAKILDTPERKNNDN